MIVQNQSKKNNFKQDEFDVVIVGAGINGAVAAAAASAAGLSVLLIDKGDFASFTSQQSSNLVWGGIKYLQSYEFYLVLKLCLARNRLMRAYPNQIREVGFLASLGPTAPFGRLLGTFGTLFYWGIGLFGTSAPRSYSAKRAKQLEPILKSGRKAVRYFDAQLPDNDSRFVYDFVRHAERLGAEVSNYTELVAAERGSDWRLTLKCSSGDQVVKAKTVINSTGPFAAGVSEILQSPTRAKLVLSKGIHLILNRKITQEDEVLAFWDEQSRLFYVLPMGDRSMIGTTDTRVDDPHTEVLSQDSEFVIRQINNQLEGLSISEADVISVRSGVRPLVVEGSAAEGADWHALSRKHVIETDVKSSVVTILGGKLTDCLNVGTEVLAELRKLGHQPKKPIGWFGEGKQRRKQEFYLTVAALCSDRDAAQRIADGIWRRHGEVGFEFLPRASFGELIPGLGITAVEIEWIVRNEHVVNREDLLRRRLPIAMARSEQEIAANSELQALLERLGL
jgi:glycerol-3-phosphate dehydrogenase